MANTAESIRQLLNLQPLPHEGGFFCETYRSSIQLPASATGGAYDGPRSAGTAIYYMVTPDSFSALHRVPGDEIFHFYLGQPVAMLQLHPDGGHERVVLGHDLHAGQRPQVIVSGGAWQGMKLLDDAASGPDAFALLGTTMAPGFDFADYEHGDADALAEEYPQAREMILALAR